MRTFSIALCAALLAFSVAPTAFAQGPITLNDVPELPAPPNDKSGYQLFLEAGALVQDGPNGEPLSTEMLAPAENLRLQRLGAARNAPALARLREALDAGIVIPTDFSTPESSTALMNDNASARQFARHLWQEGAVRAADGDAMGAAQSSLHAFRLATQIARGPVIQMLVGTATAALARKSLQENAAPLLSAAQLRQVAAQWETIGAQMPTFEQTLRAEEASLLVAMRPHFAPVFENAQDPAKRAEMLKGIQAEVDAGEMTEDEAQNLREDIGKYANSTLADLETDLRSAFEQARARAQMPYLAMTKTEPIEVRFRSMLVVSLDATTTPRTRFLSERNLVADRLLVAAMRLRAAKLDGAYPETFAAGADPFSPTLAPLIYRREGDSYLLYSVGPDGKDDGGAAIQTLETDRETGAQSVSDRLDAESTGDIVAPVF